MSVCAPNRQVVAKIIGARASPEGEGAPQAGPFKQINQIRLAEAGACVHFEREFCQFFKSTLLLQSSGQRPAQSHHCPLALLSSSDSNSSAFFSFIYFPSVSESRRGICTHPRAGKLEGEKRMDSASWRRLLACFDSFLRGAGAEATYDNEIREGLLLVRRLGRSL